MPKPKTMKSEKSVKGEAKRALPKPQMPEPDVSPATNMLAPKDLMAYYQSLYESMYGTEASASFNMASMAAAAANAGYGMGLPGFGMVGPSGGFGPARGIRKRRRHSRPTQPKRTGKEGSIYYNKKNMLWETRICYTIDGKSKQRYLGQYDSEEEAKRVLEGARKAKAQGRIDEYRKQLREQHKFNNGIAQRRNAQGHWIKMRKIAVPPAEFKDEVMERAKHPQRRNRNGRRGARSHRKNLAAWRNLAQARSDLDAPPIWAGAPGHMIDQRLLAPCGSPTAAKLANPALGKVKKERNPKLERAVDLGQYLTQDQLSKMDATTMDQIRQFIVQAESEE